jgi:hypothetical protein
MNGVRLKLLCLWIIQSIWCRNKECPDIELARGPGWSLQISLEDILLAAISHFREVLCNANNVFDQ